MSDHEESQETKSTSELKAEALARAKIAVDRAKNLSAKEQLIASDILAAAQRMPD